MDALELSDPASANPVSERRASSRPPPRKLRKRTASQSSTLSYRDPGPTPTHERQPQSDSKRPRGFTFRFRRASEDGTKSHKKKASGERETSRAPDIGKLPFESQELKINFDSPLPSPTSATFARNAPPSVELKVEVSELRARGRSTGGMAGNRMREPLRAHEGRQATMPGSPTRPLFGSREASTRPSKPVRTQTEPGPSNVPFPGPDQPIPPPPKLHQRDYSYGSNQSMPGYVPSTGPKASDDFFFHSIKKRRSFQDLRAAPEPGDTSHAQETLTIGGLTTSGMRGSAPTQRPPHERAPSSSRPLRPRPSPVITDPGLFSKPSHNPRHQDGPHPVGAGGDESPSKNATGEIQEAGEKSDTHIHTRRVSLSQQRPHQGRLRKRSNISHRGVPQSNALSPTPPPTPPPKNKVETVSYAAKPRHEHSGQPHHSPRSRKGRHKPHGHSHTKRGGFCIIA